MAQLGSVAGIAVKAFTVSGKKNECSIASARSNCFCASGEHEVLKRTWPSFSWPPGGSAAPAATVNESAAMVVRIQLSACLMTYLPLAWRRDRPDVRDASYRFGGM